MALFNKPKAAMSIPETPIQAAVGGSGTGMSQVGNFIAYTDSTARELAMSIPTIARGRDLICGAIAGLQLEMYREMWNGDDMEEVPLAPRSWLRRLDPAISNNFTFSWLVDDLIFNGRAFLVVQERTADGFPSVMTRVPASMISTLDQAGPLWFGPSNQIYLNGMQLPTRDVIQFISPNQSLNSVGRRAIMTALRIEDARMRNASSAIPAGILKQREGSEPLSAQELSDLASQFNLARSTNQTAALNQYLDYEPSNATPDKMMLIESADYSARDLGRTLGVPPYLLSVAVGAYSYQSAQQSRLDLWTYGCKPLADCIAETLSSNNVLPNGTFVKWDVDDFLSADYMGGDMEEPAETMPGEMTPNGIPPMANDNS